MNVADAEVSEYCAAELGALQGTGMAAARALIADALDLRYRLPRLWDRVLTGGVRAWQARKIAEQTRSLSWEACVDVDHALCDFVGMMPWPRFAKILSATILEADPAQPGLKTIVAKAAAGDAIWFLVSCLLSLFTVRAAQARTSRRSPRSTYDPVSLPRRPCDART